VISITIICAYVMLFLNLMQSINTANMLQRGRAEDADAWDRRCRVIFPILYAMGFAYLLVEAPIFSA